ncbi:MAG: CBS domain-containing protein [Solirubrobacteraceae bacterium]
MHATSVREAMHAGIMACTPSATVAEVAQLMTTGQVHCVAVVAAAGEQAPALSGVVTDVDLLRWATGGDTHLPAGAVVSEPAFSVSPQASVHEAAALMADRGVDHLVVVDPRGHAPLGIISALDVARVLAHPLADAAGTERRTS